MLILFAFIKTIFKMKMKVKLLSRVWLFCDPVDCSPPGSSVHGISQARVLKWVAISFPNRIFTTQGWNSHFLCWQADSVPRATREAQRRHADGQQAHEKMLNIANYQINKNQNCNEVSPHTGQNQFSSVQSLSRVRLFATPWIAAC